MPHTINAGGGFDEPECSLDAALWLAAEPAPAPAPVMQTSGFTTPAAPARDAAPPRSRWWLLAACLAVLAGGAGIALISCYKGFNCDRGAHGVGRACTEAFVSSFLAILVLNFVLAVISKAIYATFWEFKLMI